MKEETKGRIVSAVVPGILLLGTKLGNWYEKNPHHRFDAGDILILKDRRIFGYGIRPIVVVKGYEIREDEFGIAGKYDVTMHQDANGDFLQWATQNEIPQGVERIVAEQTHFKWNIEYQFRRVSVNSVDEAVAQYASKEVEQFKRVA